MNLPHNLSTVCDRGELWSRVAERGTRRLAVRGPGQGPTRCEEGLPLSERRRITQSRIPLSVDLLRRGLSVVSGLLLLLPACSRDAGTGTRTIARDSGGIEIVESTASAWSMAERWSLSREPVVTIGAREGPPETLLSFVTGVVLLEDGRIVVADAGSNSIRFYAPDGRFLSSTGRQGQGPGEFADIGYIARIAGDTILVADGILQRISVLDPSGINVRSFGLELADSVAYMGFLNVTGALASGELMAFAGSGRGLQEQDAGSLIQDTLHFFGFERSGASGDRLAALPGVPRWGLRAGGAVSFPYIPLSGGPSAAAGGTTFVVADGLRAQVRVFDRARRPIRQIRWRIERRSTDSEMAYLRDHLLGVDRTPAQRNANRQLLNEAPIPDSLPAAGAVLVDDEGNVWVERYRTPWDSAAIWDVLAVSGEWLGTVPMPSRFRLHHVGTGRVAGVWRDDLNVEYVRLYTLIRPGEGGGPAERPAGR